MLGLRLHSYFTPYLYPKKTAMSSASLSQPSAGASLVHFIVFWAGMIYCLSQ